MSSGYFLTEFGFHHTKPVLSGNLKPLGVDRVHYSGEFPAVFFKEVPKFGMNELKEIAKLQRKIWNYRKVFFLYVSSPAEIRFYNCSREPFNFKEKNIDIERELSKYEFDRCDSDDKSKIKLLSEIFSAIHIDNGSIWLHEQKKYRDKIDLQKRVDKKLVDALLKTARILKDELINDIDDIDNEKSATEIVHALLMRSLFSMYLEDKGATPKEFYPKGTSYLDLLNDLEATYSFYDKIEKHFNGNVFPVTELERKYIKTYHLQSIKNCLYDGDPEHKQQKLFDWRLFDFSIIQVELLSEIYENFLNAFDSEGKKQSGAYYTPLTLVELILNQVLPVNGLKKDYRLKILDPACGSGIFLVEAYKRLVQRWKNANPGKKIRFSDLSNILEQSIFGVELDPSAIKVSAFSLYLAMLEFLDPKDMWFHEGETFPFLIKDVESLDERDWQGNNLFRTNTISKNGEFEKQKYDLIIGNPPFRRQSIPQYAKDYLNKYGFASEMAIPFLHKSVQLTDTGRIALVFNTKILTNTLKTYQNFRKWLFQDCYVERVYNLSIFRKAPKTFGGQLFSSAIGPISVVFFSPFWPEKPEPTIEYWAPKTYVRNHVVDGVITDSSDFKYLPRDICQQTDTEIWKIAQWGTLADYFLLGRFRKSKKIGEVINENSGLGHQLLDSTTKKIYIDDEISDLPFILPERIQRYYTDPSNLSSINAAIKTQKSKEIYLKYYNRKSVSDLPLINAFRRLGGDKKAYYSPHVLIKEGLSKKRVCASFFDENCSFNSEVYGINHSDSQFLKALTCYFNSDFAKYFLFLVSASWGIEREEIKPNEFKKLPLLSDQFHQKLSEIYDDIAKNCKDLFYGQASIAKNEQKAEVLIGQALNLSEKENILFHDVVTYTISLFFDGEKSIALRPVSPKEPETESYAKILCDEINHFLVIGDTKINAHYYSVSLYTPLCMVVLRFVKSSEVVAPERVDSDVEFQKNLQEINEFTLQKYSRNIYVHKQIRYYDYENESIFIIKPNQKRFWTRSQGIDDAHSIITEIAMQEE